MKKVKNGEGTSQHLQAHEDDSGGRKARSAETSTPTHTREPTQNYDNCTRLESLQLGADKPKLDRIETLLHMILENPR